MAICHGMPIYYIMKEGLYLHVESIEHENDWEISKIVAKSKTSLHIVMV